MNETSEKTHYNIIFSEELKKLNPAQRTAVEHLEGPVLVIAGPGTGKTQILSARIGNILSSADTQASPQNILCLTYTEAGTVAMRKRLLKFIGPDAYKVHIFTFHGFCNQVIQENLDYFGFNDLQPLTDLEAVEVFQKLIDSLDAKHPLKRLSGDAYFEADRLKVLFDIMKRESWSPEFISEKVEEYINDLPNKEDYVYKRANASKGIKVGDLKVSLINEEKERMAMLQAGACEFYRYQQMLQEIKRYDYNDMILWVLNAFKKNENLLLHYQEKYHYFLVDEFQDTNGSQNEILNMVTSFWDIPNVFVVGDDDQSIFRFQGANVKNIVDFYSLHKDNLKTILLTENYRSSQKILDISKKVIDHNKERLVKLIEGLDKDLIAKGTLSASPTVPTVVEYYNTIHEEAGIINEIEKLYQQGEDLSEVAVIYRSHRLVENIVKGLEHRKIPLNIKQRINILELPFVKCILNILTYLQKEYNEPDSAENILYEIMHYSFFDVSPRDAAMIARECSGKEGDKKKSWRELIGSRERMFQLNLYSARALSDLEENIDFWLKELPNLTLQGLFEKVLVRGGILSYAMRSPDRVWLMQVLNSLADFIKEESIKRKNISLKDFLILVDQMNYYKVPVYLNKVTHAENGVNFVTAHSSKGLEFKYVFLVSSSSNCWESQSAKRRTYKIPDTLTESAVEDKSEEERRLFYVAVTRAKEFLQISFPGKNNEGKELEMSQFVAEILESEMVHLKKVSLPDEEVILLQSQLMVGLEKPSFPILEEPILKDILKTYRMNVSHLNKYLKCPLTFYFENVLKVPMVKSESLGFGNAVHYALNVLFSTMIKDSNKAFPEKRDLYSFFLKGLKRFHSHFSEQEFSRKSDFGKEILPEYYDIYVNHWNKNVLTEYSFYNVVMEGIPLTGVIDKLEFDGKKVNVVDYKTGNPDNGRKKLNPPNDKDPLGGDYWRQLIFYKILIEADKRNSWEMISGEIDFIQKNTKKEFSKVKVYIKPEDVELVKSQIKEAYKKITDFQFNPGCGKEDCQWCNFVKLNYKGYDLSLQETAD